MEHIKQSIQNHKKAASVMLAAFFFLSLVLFPLAPQTAEAASATPGKLILMQTVKTEGSWYSDSLSLTLDEVPGKPDTVKLPLTADDGSGDEKKLPRDTAVYAKAFYDKNGVQLTPMKLAGRWSDTVDYQSGNIGFSPKYFNTSGAANNAGEWRVITGFNEQMPASTQADVTYSLTDSAKNPQNGNQGWGSTARAGTYTASGSTPLDYAAKIRSAYQLILKDYFTDYWAVYTYDLPAEVTAALSQGKDVYVLGTSMFMYKDNVEVQLIKDKGTGEFTKISVRAKFSSTYGQTSQTISSAVFGGMGENYVPYNNYWVQFPAYQGNTLLGRTSYSDIWGLTDRLPSNPAPGAGTFDVLVNGSVQTGAATLGTPVETPSGTVGSAYQYSDQTLLQTDYGAGLFYFLADFSTDTSLTHILTADPKEREVAGSPGTPATLGEDVTVTVDFIQPAASLQDWTKRLTRVSGVDVYLKVTAPDSRPLTCDTDARFSNPTGQKVSLSNEDFLALLKKKLTFTDKVGTKTINAGQIIRYDYTASLYVEFKENGSGANVRVTSASPQAADYASFFRVKDPPPLEYVKYISSPGAYSELKQGTIGSEDFEAMAGVPTTRSLYFAVGGSEFIVDFEGVIRKEQTARRTYRVHYDGCDCEFKLGDQAKSFTFPSGGSGSTTIASMHNGGSCTVTWTGATPWTGSGGVSEHTAWVTNAWDDSSYNTAMSQATAYAATVNGTVYSYTAASDGQTRIRSGWGASASGSNPHNSGSAVSGQPYIAPTYEDVLDGGGNPTGAKTMTHPGQPLIPGQYTPGTANSWTITVTWSVPAHTGCGPCCQHVLPAVDDTWTQEIPYDYLDFTKAEVWRLEQGRLVGMGTITGGTASFTADVLQGAPSLFYNIAAAETSRDGRFRYSVEPSQHDAVTWNKGKRSGHCDKQDQPWGTGIKYTNTGYPHQAGYLQGSSTAKDQATPEYAEFLRNRQTPVTATVISDFLILQTSSGDQSVVYYDKKSAAVQTEQDYAPVPLTKAEVWDSNPNSASKWSPEQINIGSYNGNYADTGNKYKGTGSGGRTATVFDSDPAGTVSRPARPSVPLYVGKYNIGIQRTLPNDQYDTGMASAVWKTALNYNPDTMPTPFSIPTYIRNAPYSDEHSKINDIVVHDPVSAEYAMLLSLDNARDQRTAEDQMRGSARNNALADAGRCPGTPEACECRELNCHYQGTAYHTATCYTSATPKVNNAHYHTVSCVDMNQVKAALTYLTTAYSYTGWLPSIGWIGHNGSESWTISLPYTATWTVTANIDTETNYDWVYLNGERRSGRQTWTYTFTGNTLSIQFTTDYSVESSGFCISSITGWIPTSTMTGVSWGLVDLSQLGTKDHFTITTEWLAKQSATALSHILQCGNLPVNIHICNASCNHTSVLICNEPHHTGGHYELGSANSAVCWEPVRGAVSWKAL